MEMNAYKLADALDWVCENHLIGIGDADFKATAAMLRQLKAENDALRKTVDSLFLGMESSLALNKAQAERQEK
jgi:hypothetical protein